MQVTIEQAAKEAVDFPESKGFGSVSSSAPRIMVACAEICDLPARATNP